MATQQNGIPREPNAQPADEQKISPRTEDEYALWLGWRAEQPENIYDEHGNLSRLAVASWNQCLQDYREDREATKKSLGYRTLDEFVEKPIEWLWKNRVPRGEASLFEGDPETGKTILTSHVVACVTRGWPISADDVSREPGDVLLVVTEDSMEKVIKPQLRVHGADLDRVNYMKMHTDDEGNLIPLEFPRDTQRMRGIIETEEVKLVVISPITGCFGEETNTNNDASLRAALTPVAQIAQETDAAMILIRHLNKDQSMKALYRGGGSIAFMGISRTALVTGEYEGQRAVAMVKNNLYDKRAVFTLAFDLIPPLDEQVPQVKWKGELSITAEELVNPDRRKKSPRKEEAKELLSELLEGNGWVDFQELDEERDKAGFNKKTWEAAAEDLGVKKDRKRRADGTTEKWLWSL